MRNGLTGITAAMIILIAAVVAITACQRRPVIAYSDFVHLSSRGWLHSLPLTFKPEFDDSTARYELLLAVRHDNSYPFRTLPLVVDIIAEDSTVNRQMIDLPLADEYGNWTGGGFGSLYQNKLVVSRDIIPKQARSVVVWHAMADCDTIHGIVNMGIIMRPQ